MIAPANRAVELPAVNLPIISSTTVGVRGKPVATWHAVHPASNAVVVLLHPIRSDRRAMLARAALLYGEGYSIVIIDLQAHGETPGDHITMGYLEKDSVRSAVEFARRTFANQQIVVLGWSLGGAAALLASPLEVDAMILESVYPTIAQAAANRIELRLGSLHHLLTPFLLAQLPLRLGISADELRPIDSLPAAGCPVLIMGGENDEHTTEAETRGMFSAGNEPKELAVFSNAAHTDLLKHDPAMYKSTVLRFLKQHLGDPVANPALVR